MSESSDDCKSSNATEHAVRHGTQSVVAGQIVSQLISFAVLAALYRLVAPDQFGLLGMAVPLLILARIVSSFGLNVAAVQRSRLSSEQLTSLFWINLTLSLVAAVAVTILGPLLSWLYSAPRLAELCAVLSGTLVLMAFSAQHQALLERKLKMGRLMIARLLGQAAGGVIAIVFAVRGAGVWALVIQQYAELSVLAILVWNMAHWRPGRPRRGVGAKPLVQFGGYYSLSSLMFFVADNADKVLIALFLGSTRSGQAALGMYSQAFNLTMKPVLMVSTPITGIMLPVLSRVVDQRQRFAMFVTRFFRMVGIVLLPCGIGLAVVGMDVMIVLGGERWQAAGWMIVALAPTILARGFLNTSGSVFASSGRARPLLIAAAATALFMVIGCLTGFHVGGLAYGEPWGPVYGVAISYSFVSVVILLVPFLHYCFRPMSISLRTVFAPLLRPLLAAVVMGIMVASFRCFVYSAVSRNGLALLTVVAFGVSAYGLLARQDIHWLIQQFRVPRND